MTLPDASAVRSYMEAYQLSASIISDTWINNEIANFVVPYVERFCRTKLMSTATVTEWYSGNGSSILLLNRRNIVNVVTIALVRGSDFLSFINLDAIDVNAAEGSLKARTRVSEGYYFSIFPRGENNLRITYQYGSALNTDLFQAVLMLACCSVLEQLEGRTGGGSITTEGWSRDFGNMGKFSNIRKKLHMKANSIMRDYSSAVIGQ